jgi:chemotaxis protein MotB
MSRNKKKKKKQVGEPKAGVPGWMVSFGDMMTLILTFFILLVSMSREQEEGLMAKGVGSFIIAVRSFGLDGLMNEAQQAEVYDDVRARFRLPPEHDPENASEAFDAADVELIRAELTQGLQPTSELNQPSVAIFPPGEAELTPAAQRYLDLLATTLRPHPPQVLVLEGHASGAEGRDLAFARADAVRTYLIERLGYRATRVEARAWIAELGEQTDGAARTVDARLITPHPTED